MKKLFLLLAPLALLVGCSTVPQISPALVEAGVSAGVRAGVQKYPQALPYVKASGELICSAANSTNISPANVVADLDAVSALKTPEGALIMQIAIDAYTYVYNSYGDKAINNVPKLKEYLGAVCNGVTAGVATVPSSKALSLKQTVEWPQIK